MIEFSGELNGAAKKFLLDEQIKLQVKVSLATMIVVAIPAVIAAVLWNPAALVILLVPLIMLIGSCLKPDKKDQRLFVPKRIFLDLEEETIVHICETQERFHMINSVKQVIDYGEFYYFVFEYADRDPYFVCQKSLLTQGTLEEFEALFEGKIERKENL